MISWSARILRNRPPGHFASHRRAASVGGNDLGFDPDLRAFQDIPFDNKVCLHDAERAPPTPPQSRSSVRPCTAVIGDLITGLSRF